jgi:hypothetical protein
VFATALLAYGTDAQDSVISAELVFIGHSNILTVEVLCGGLHTYRTWLSRQGLRGHAMTDVETFQLRVLTPTKANRWRKLVRTPVAVEKGTNTVISSDSPRFRERSLNHLRTDFWAISTQK